MTIVPINQVLSLSSWNDLKLLSKLQCNTIESSSSQAKISFRVPTHPTRILLLFKFHSFFNYLSNSFFICIFRFNDVELYFVLSTIILLSIPCFYFFVVVIYMDMFLELGTMLFFLSYFYLQ